MNIKKTLSRETVSLNLQGEDKNSIIEELVDMMVSAGKITNRKAAIKAILDREKKMSTGMQNGIAIPHGKTDTVESLAVAIGLKKEGLDFKSLDGKPSIIFIMTISPVNRTGPHIQFLAEISRQLNEPETRKRVLDASSPDQIIEILSG